MIQYSLEVAICWAVLFLIYICFLRRETFFSINRGYLLSSLIIGLVIPILRLIDWQWQEEVVLNESLQFIATGPNYIATSISIDPIHETSSWSVLDILLVLYWLGVLFMTARLAKGIYKIFELYKEGQKTKKEGFTLVETNHFHLPFSFLNYVFFSKDLSVNTEVEHIIKHELTHIKSRHSYDVFFVEILHVLFWWNPLIYLYKRELRQLHEYLADAMVLTDTNHKIYGQILLGQSESGLEIALTHQFFNSHLKQRIMMMYKQKSKRPAMIKYLVALPVILSLCILFSFSYSDYKNNNIEKVKMEMESFFASDTPEQWELTQPIILVDGVYKERKGAIRLLKSLLLEYPKHSKLITERFSYEAAINGLQLTFNDESGTSFCTAVNETLVNKITEFFQNNKQNLASPQIANKRSEFKSTYPEYSNLIEDRFNYEIRKKSYSSNDNLKKELDDYFKTESVSLFNMTLKSSYEGFAERYRDQLNYIEFRFQNAALASDLKIKFPSESDNRFCLYDKDTPIEALGSDIIQINAQDTVPISTPVSAVEKSVDNSDGYFKVAEVMPRFPGCENLTATDEEKRKCANDEMLKFIYQNVLYPAEARKNGIQGLTVVQFFVNTDGTLSDIKTVRDIGGGAGEAARKVVSLMNDRNLTWTPGYENGNAVKVLYTLPVRFKLEGDSKREAPVEKVKLPEGEKIDQVVVVGYGEQKEIFKVVDQMPRFPGCEDLAGTDEEKRKCANGKLLEFIYQNLKYPEAAQKAGIEGVTVVQFVVNPDGGLEDIKLARDIGGEAGEAAKRTVQLMVDQDLKWTAGMQNGKAVHVQYTLPVRFKLEANSATDKSQKLKDDNGFSSSRMSPLYDVIAPLRDQFQGSFPLTIVNGNKYAGLSVNFNKIDVTKEQIKSVDYLDPTQAKSKYGEIAFHGALIIELYDVDETDLEKIGKIIIPGSQVLPIAAKEEVFKKVEQMPRFPDCEDKCIGENANEECHKQELLSFIYSHLNYPEEAKKAGVEGMAVVQFVIDKSGSVIEPKIVRDIGGGTAKEVLYVVELMNNLTKKWTPGYQAGEAVNVLYTLPVRFKLGDSEESSDDGNKIKLENENSDKDPLIVYDGEIIEKDVNELNKDEIANISVLKGQAALDKYGDQAINGVVEITSKQKANKSTLTQESEILTIDKNELNQQKEANTSNAELRQNRPNPVIDQTIIEFVLPERRNGTITVINVIGEKLYERSDTYAKGVNTITLNKSDLKETGVLYYSIEAGDFKATRKMTVLD